MTQKTYNWKQQHSTQCHMGVKPGHTRKGSETNCWHLKCTVTEGSYLITWTERKTNHEICDKLRTEKDLLQRAIQRKLHLTTYAGWTTGSQRY